MAGGIGPLSNTGCRAVGKNAIDGVIAFTVITGAPASSRRTNAAGRTAVIETGAAMERGAALGGRSSSCTCKWAARGARATASSLLLELRGAHQPPLAGHLAQVERVVALAVDRVIVDSGSGGTGGPAR